MKQFDRRKFLQNSLRLGLVSAVGIHEPCSAFPEPGSKSQPIDDGLLRELYRPRFHFTPAYGFMNDPNGLVFYGGEYHLFFQHNVDIQRPLQKTQWGHAVSQDLVRWQQLPPAIVAEDGYGAFSGSCVVDWNNTAKFKTGQETPIVAAFTSWGRGQFIAFSNDRCRTFSLYEGNPVIKHPNDSKRSFPVSPRDPTVVWYEKGGYWVLIMYQSMEDEKGFGFYTSSDLKNWEFSSHLPGFYVCPDLFQLPLDGDTNDLRWVIMDWEQYATGDFDGKAFRLHTSPTKLDAASGKGSHTGLGVSANQTWKTSERIIQIAWLRGGQYPNMPFSQQMAFPTRLSLRNFPEGIRLCREPVRELELLYAKKHKVDIWRLDEHSQNPLAGIKAEFLDIQAAFTIPLKMKGRILLNVRGVPIEYDTLRNLISCYGRSEMIKPVKEKLFLRVLVDRTSLEIYVDGGRVVFSFFHFFDPAIKELELFVDSGDVNINGLNVYEVQPAYERN